MQKVPYKNGDYDATEVEFQIRNEDWNEYQLMDGSRIKIKMVVSGFYKVPGEYDVEGNPVYVVRSKNVLAVNAPDSLKKKP